MNGGVLTVNADKTRYFGEDLWLFERGNMWVFDGEGRLEHSERFEKKVLNITLEPELIMDTSRDINHFSYNELRALMLKLERLNVLPVAVQAAFHERFAYPLLNLSLLFILFPFFYVKHRISRVFVLGMAILMSFICYGIFSSGFTLAKSGKIPVSLGVWMVHIFILAGVIIYSIVSTKVKKTAGE